MTPLTQVLSIMPFTTGATFVYLLFTTRHFLLRQTHRDTAGELPPTPLTIVNDDAVLTTIHGHFLDKSARCSEMVKQNDILYTAIEAKVIIYRPTPIKT